MLQSSYLEQECSYQNMNSFSHIGNVRKSQEDSFIIDSHTNYENVKLMAVADGMGGLKDGEIASNIALRILVEWFQNLHIDNLTESKILRIYNEIANIIDEEIRVKCNGATTLSTTLVNGKDAFCLNIGDSRIYARDKDSFYQVNEDHSITWDLWQNGIIEQKDDMIFHRQNNLITSRLGDRKKMLKIDYKFVDQFDYLYVFSDGITDCIFESDLFNILKKNPEDMKALVYYILSSKIEQNYLGEEYYKLINGGKDNATALVLRRDGL